MEWGSGHPWVVVGGKVDELAHCKRCGVGLTLNLPQRIEVVSAAMKAFDRAHADCQEQGYRAPTSTTPEEWAAGRDVGISSMTIWSFFMGRTSLLGYYDVPHDPGDFGRCYRLLKLFPKWRAKIGDMVAWFPSWNRMIAVWGELEALYEEEAPSGWCPKLYARLEELQPGVVGPDAQEKRIKTARNAESAKD